METKDPTADVALHDPKGGTRNRISWTVKRGPKGFPAVLVFLATVSAAMASGPSPVGKWVCHVRFPLRGSETDWKAGVIEAEMEQGKILLILKPGGTYVFQPFASDGSAMIGGNGVWSQRRGRLTIVNSYPGSRPNPLYLSKDGKRLSFRWSGARYEFVRVR